MIFGFKLVLVFQKIGEGGEGPLDTGYAPALSYRKLFFERFLIFNFKFTKKIINSYKFLQKFQQSLKSINSSK